MFLYITLICRSFKYMYVRIQVMSVDWIAGTVLANVYFCPPVSFIVRHPEAENPWRVVWSQSCFEISVKESSLLTRKPAV